MDEDPHLLEKTLLWLILMILTFLLYQRCG